ncbi:hypothetical protein DPEC_G00049160 [Dallia pectoralis]|uniref:Uncharacterized protein n=1 Tax=Dallia pectoralis TaxID=75939 RepID=A0ACC2HB09_DALPE|nr:hypothetical protein DPEC_G00049160 [Dallia pectoralis]
MDTVGLDCFDYPCVYNKQRHTVTLPQQIGPVSPHPGDTRLNDARDGEEGLTALIDSVWSRFLSSGPRARLGPPGVSDRQLL